MIISSAYVPSVVLEYFSVVNEKLDLTLNIFNILQQIVKTINNLNVSER